MLIHSVLFEVWHHISKSRLSGRLGSLLLYFVHLLKVLLCDRIELGSKPFLSLQWSCLRLWNLIDFEPTSHGGVHHDLAGSLNLLQAVESYVIQVACAVEIPLFVTHYLLEKVISSCFPLLSFEKQIVCWRYLVMFVVLDIRYSLV